MATETEKLLVATLHNRINGLLVVPFEVFTARTLEKERGLALKKLETSLLTTEATEASQMELDGQPNATPQLVS